MKKLLCMFMFITVVLAFSGCATIQHEKDASVKLYMVRDSITVTEEITGEEAEVILGGLLRCAFRLLYRLLRRTAHGCYARRQLPVFGSGAAGLRLLCDAGV